MKYIKVLLVFYGGLFLIDCMKAASAKKNVLFVKNDDLSYKIDTFEKRKKRWERTLTVPEKEFHTDLFETYHELYNQYKKNPSDQQIQVRILAMIQVFDNLMQHWQSFYKEHVSTEMFNHFFSDWQKHLTPVQKQLFKPEIDSYQIAYKAYDVNPIASESKKKLGAARKQLQKIM